MATMVPRRSKREWSTPEKRTLVQHERGRGTAFGWLSTSQCSKRQPRRAPIRRKSAVDRQRAGVPVDRARSALKPPTGRGVMATRRSPPQVRARFASDLRPLARGRDFPRSLIFGSDLIVFPVRRGWPEYVGRRLRHAIQRGTRRGRRRAPTSSACQLRVHRPRSLDLAQSMQAIVNELQRCHLYGTQQHARVATWAGLAGRPDCITAKP